MIRLIPILVLLLASGPQAAFAQTAGKAELESTVLSTRLLKAPVFSSDGQLIGEVADIILDERARLQRLRILAGARLGFGSHTVDIPRGIFTVVRGAVVVDLPADAISALPVLSEQEPEK